MDAPTLRRSLLGRPPGASFVAFVASAALLAAFTRIRLAMPFGASDRELDELNRLIAVGFTATVVSHSLLAALAARARRPWVGVALLLLATSALPWIVTAARVPLAMALRRVAPYTCTYPSEHCPPSGWNPAIGLLVGALLAPIVATSIIVRRDNAFDAAARTLWITGAWIAILTSVLRMASVSAFGPMLAAWAIAGTMMLFATLDTLHRRRRLRALTRDGIAYISEARADDPSDLRRYASMPSALRQDHVLRLDRSRRDGAYRAARFDESIARVPGDLDALIRALDARLFHQLVALLAATAVACTLSIL